MSEDSNTPDSGGEFLLAISAISSTAFVATINADRPLTVTKLLPEMQ